MYYSCTQSITGMFSMIALLLTLEFPALGQTASAPEESLKEVQSTLAVILDQLGPCKIPPVWRTKFEEADRFVAVLDGSAYCDKETGLVWDSSPIVSPRTWIDAVLGCTNLNTGGRKGWALPR